MIRSQAFIAGLLLATFASAASAFVDPPVLVPAHPVAGEIVDVSIRSGICDAFVERSDYPQIFQDGHSIRIVLASLHYADSAICVYPITTSVFSVATFPVGSYTLQVDRTYENYFGEVVVETLGVLPFSVSAAPAVVVSAVDRIGVAALLFSIFGLAMIGLRRRVSTVIAVLVVLIPLGVRAQTASDAQAIAVLLDADALDAPTSQMVVDYYAAASRSGKPPLASLAAGNPETVVYLLPTRASGDFDIFLAAHPDSTRAKLERYLVALYPTVSSTKKALATLSADSNVTIAYKIPRSIFTSVQLLQYGLDSTEGVDQYGRDALNIDAGWQLAGGYAVVGMIDSGLAVAHPALRQFSVGGQYLGGNFVPVASLDLGGWPHSLDSNVDEAEPVPLPPTSPCNPQGLPAVPPSYVGHGTHTSGLLAANVDAGLGVKGTCKQCAIAMWKISAYVCQASSQKMVPTLNPEGLVASITYLADTGAQVINMSFGGQRDDADYCANNPSIAYCLALTYARDREIVLVAASGNDRSKLNFPASDPKVVAAGGFQPGLVLWDESPGSQTTCPYYGQLECGSNYTTVTGDPKQELMASADAVLSTTYPGYDWNPQLQCGDS